jgi:PPP family 3-phenylpropionic acid transporter
MNAITSRSIPQARLATFYFAYFGFVGAFSPYFSLYLQSLGHGAAAIGALLAGQQAMRLVAPTLWAGMADRRGRHAPLLRVALGLVVVVALALCFVSEFWTLLVLMALLGFFTNAALPLFEAITFMHLRDDIGRYGRLRVWGSIGFIVAVSGIGMTLDIWPIALLPWLVLATLAASFAVALAVPDVEEVRERPQAASVWPVMCRPEVIAFFAACFLMSVAHGPLYAFYSIHLAGNGWSKTLVGAMWSLGVIAEIVVFLAMPQLTRRFDMRVLLAFSFACGVLRFVMIGWLVDSYWLMALAQLLHAATFGLYHATAVSFINRWFAGPLRARGQALYASLTFGAGGMLGSFGSGVAWELFGAAPTYAAASLCCLIGVVLLIWKLPAGAGK